MVSSLIDVTVDPVSRVLMPVAKQLNIKKWLQVAPAYIALCTRADPIKASEAEKQERASTETRRQLKTALCPKNRYRCRKTSSQ